MIYQHSYVNSTSIFSKYIKFLINITFFYFPGMYLSDMQYFMIINIF